MYSVAFQLYPLIAESFFQEELKLVKEIKNEKSTRKID
jgi:hypothetical protein